MCRQGSEQLGPDTPRLRVDRAMDVTRSQDDEGSVATPESSLKRKRQPRNSACQNCAALKMKCLPTDQGKCERCLRMDRECVPAIPKPRKRRTESGIGLEAGELSMLQYAASSSTAGPPPKFDLPRAGEDAAAERRSLLTRHDLSHTGSRSFVSLFARGLGNVAACEELLRGVDYNFVANSFTVFRQVTSNFPFVELSPAADPIDYIAKRPALTLAVCIVAAASNQELQSRLSQAFQYCLSSKVILAGEKSIDMLTGLMVYLAWHHQYLSKPQIYQELFLLAAMAGDFGLYRPSPQPLDLADAVERDRAFVGCFCLCTSLSAIAFDKPSPFHWTPNLRLCAENVAASGRMPSDQTVIAALELALAIDDLEEAIRQSAHHANFAQVADLQVKAGIQRLKALKREHPTLGGLLSFAAATIHCYQRLFRASDSPEYAALIQCACAAKEYIDDVLARPASMLHHASIIDWVNLLEVLVIMARVTKPMPNASGWETGALSEMLQPDIALDRLCSHMASAAANDPLSPRNESLLAWLRKICDGIRHRMLHDGSTTQGGPHDFDYFGNGVLDMTFWNSLTGT